MCHDWYRNDKEPRICRASVITVWQRWWNSCCMFYPLNSLFIHRQHPFHALLVNIITINFFGFHLCAGLPNWKEISYGCKWSSCCCKYKHHPFSCAYGWGKGRGQTWFSTSFFLDEFHLLHFTMLRGLVNETKSSQHKLYSHCRQIVLLAGAEQKLKKDL